MNLSIPQLSFVVLIGSSGSGKSTFARTHFLSTEVLSSDYCRGLVSDNENDQAATKDAFEVLQFIAAKRLAAGRLTVVDATNVQHEARQPLVALARKFHTLPVAIVFDLPEAVCHARNRDRDDRNFGEHVIRQQRSQLRRSIKGLKREGFAIFSCCDRRRKLKRFASNGRPSGTTSGLNMAPSTSSGTCTVAATNLKNCWPELVMCRRRLKRRGRAGRRFATLIRKAVVRCSSATSSTADHASSTR